MPTADRFEPQAARAMASMFDDVSGRYDLLNRVMTLGQDGAWREAMWRGVPDENVLCLLLSGEMPTGEVAHHPAFLAGT